MEVREKALLRDISNRRYIRIDIVILVSRIADHGDLARLAIEEGSELST